MVAVCSIPAEILYVILVGGKVLELSSISWDATQLICLVYVKVFVHAFEVVINVNLRRVLHRELNILARRHHRSCEVLLPVNNTAREFNTGHGGIEWLLHMLLVTTPINRFSHAHLLFKLPIIGSLLALLLLATSVEVKYLLRLLYLVLALWYLGFHLANAASMDTLLSLFLQKITGVKTFHALLIAALDAALIIARGLSITALEV